MCRSPSVPIPPLPPGGAAIHALPASGQTQPSLVAVPILLDMPGMLAGSGAESLSAGRKKASNSIVLLLDRVLLSVLNISEQCQDSGGEQFNDRDEFGFHADAPRSDSSGAHPSAVQNRRIRRHTARSSGKWSRGQGTPAARRRG